MAKNDSNDASDDDADHDFGGAWTEIKLEAVEYYLNLYAKALSAHFDLRYIDAFAGSGRRTVMQIEGGLLTGTPISVKKKKLDGSAPRALRVTPPFSEYIFIEKNARRYKALKALKSKFAGKKIRCVRGNANDEIEKLLREPWVRSGKGRAVVFLDPYSLQVEWKTLVALAKTRVVDVWYLFPLRDVVRQLAHDFQAIDTHKAKALDRVLGPDWREL